MKAPSKPAKKTDQDARYETEAPQVIGDFGQDDAFSTESHPEGLRYGEKRRPPGVEYKGKKEASEVEPEHTPPISVGSDPAS